MSRAALVPRGSRGIGLAIAEQLSRDQNVAVVRRTTPPQDLLEQVFAILVDFDRRGPLHRGDPSRH
jgi:NAD(P)-dependent dehydrogenase (short-subunit alcohol dehydrogenase family)